MNDGIQIENASLTVSEAGLEGLLSGQGGEVTLRNLELVLSEGALNRLLARRSPEGQPPLRVQLRPGEVVLQLERGGAPARVHLQVAGLRVEVAPGAVRLRSE